MKLEEPGSVKQDSTFLMANWTNEGMHYHTLSA